MIIKNITQKYMILLNNCKNHIENIQEKNQSDCADHEAVVGLVHEKFLLASSKVAFVS
jgi:hypothetical protein